MHMTDLQIFFTCMGVKRDPREHRRTRRCQAGTGPGRPGRLPAGVLAPGLAPGWPGAGATRDPERRGVRTGRGSPSPRPFAPRGITPRSAGRRPGRLYGAVIGRRRQRGNALLPGRRLVRADGPRQLRPCKGEFGDSSREQPRTMSTMPSVRTSPVSGRPSSQRARASSEIMSETSASRSAMGSLVGSRSSTARSGESATPCTLTESS